MLLGTDGKGKKINWQDPTDKSTIPFSSSGGKEGAHTFSQMCGFWWYFFEAKC